jgi:hypothetical protein
MAAIGYFISSEEHPPHNLVRYAQQAESAGFTYAMHPGNLRRLIDDRPISIRVPPMRSWGSWARTVHRVRVHGTDPERLVDVPDSARAWTGEV